LPHTYDGMTLIDFDTALHPRDASSGRFEDKAQSVPEFRLDVEYPSRAVSLSDAQNVTLNAFEIHNQLEQAPFLRHDVGGRVVATYSDVEAHEFLHEVTVDEHGRIEDEYIGGSIGIRSEAWKRMTPETVETEVTSPAVTRDAALSVEQSARADQMTPDGFVSSVRVDENGVGEVLTVRADGVTAYLTRVFRDGSVIETSEYIERTYDGEMAWVPMPTMRARRFARNGPVA
jgi:hypothetical protein